MADEVIAQVKARASALGFTQAGDPETARFVGALVRLVEPRHVLELGTGLGLTTYHILSNLGAEARIDSVERDTTLAAAAAAILPRDPRLRIHGVEGEAFIAAARPATYDFIFADAWPGKYRLLDETLALVKPRGLYVVDDMTPTENWAPDQAAKAESLLQVLLNARGWRFTVLPYGSGLAFGVRR